MQSFFGKTSVCVIEKAPTVTRGLCAVAAVLMGLGIESRGQDYRTILDSSESQAAQDDDDRHSLFVAAGCSYESSSLVCLCCALR